MNLRIDRAPAGPLLDVVSGAELSIAFRACAVLFVTVLTSAAAQVSIPLPFTPVPFTLQPMIVLVGSAALGARLGASSQILYLLLGIAGWPVFAASPILPQGLGVEVHVVRETLGEAEPDVVRGDRQRAVVVKRVVRGLGERVRVFATDEPLVGQGHRLDPALQQALDARAQVQSFAGALG